MTRLFVSGEPAPQGSKRHVGHGRMVESSKKVGPWRAEVAWQIGQASVWPISGPVKVDLLFYLKRPTSTPKSRRRPAVRPDVDKLARSTLDAIVASGWIEDDSRVVDLICAKHYAEPGEPTGVAISIEEI